MQFLRMLEARHISRTLQERISGYLTSRVGVEKGGALFREGQASSGLYVVERGWLAQQTMLGDGTTVIADFALPGEIAGLNELAWATSASDLIAMTPVEAWQLDRRRLDDLVLEAPEAGSLFLTLMAVRTTAAADRHTVTLRTNGRDRLLYLLLDLHARQSVVAPVDWIELPLTQQQLADTVGLTNVHVNSLLKQLDNDGVIERGRGRVRLHGIEALRQRLGYRERWLQVDLSWTSLVTGRPDGTRQGQPDPITKHGSPPRPATARRA